ncbi:class I adenylate-forming enzyme family protein [Arthrobacter mobilis]|uniref:AMP-binding protein n=1 Tax=Arthrobacter mobilis TaxID=2724944 RepID=A0A7X6HB71_9MICC|nr:AMP-binding protein [Arthrobacter mobilis]NKX53876.1 AMP-binding protein [Arthrobacter mobilis]
MPFVDRMVDWAARDPDRDAVVIDGQRLSYAELCRRAARLPLPEPAGGPRQLVALDLGSTIDFVVAFTAVVGRGLVAAVLDPAWPPAVRSAALEQLRPGTVITTAGPAGAEMTPGTPAALADGDPGREFYCGFTSGTTRTPKAFVRTVGSWQRSLERSTAWFGTAAGDRVLVPGPLSASLSLYALAECLYAGATFHGQTTPDTAAALDLLSGEALTQLVAVPSQLRMLGRRARSPWRSLRSIVSGGAKLGGEEAAALRRLAPRAAVHEYYGASELGFVAARLAGPGAGPHLVGRPFPGVELRIGPPDDGAAAPGAEPGTGDPGPGTIWVRSDMVCLGYLAGDDGLSFRRQGQWATVGDYGWLDASGQLHVAGRSADMIVTGGFNVYPHEVEEVLRSAGCDAVVVGLPDGLRGRCVAAVIRSDGPPAFTAGTLRRLCGAGLAPFKVPRRFYWVREWARGPGGKTSRPALVRAIEAGDADVHVLG